MTGLIDLKTNWVSPPSAVSCINGLYSYWQGQKGAKACPSKSDIRPKDLIPHLPNVFLVDVLDEMNFRFRVAGSRFCDLTQRRMAGDFIEAIFPDMFCDEVRKAWQQASDGATVLGKGQVWIPAKNFLQWEGICSPCLNPERLSIRLSAQLRSGQGRRAENPNRACGKGQG